MFIVKVLAPTFSQLTEQEIVRASQNAMRGWREEQMQQTTSRGVTVMYY